MQGLEGKLRNTYKEVEQSTSFFQKGATHITKSFYLTEGVSIATFLKKLFLFLCFKYDQHGGVMAEILFKAFLSCSLQPEDKEAVEFFKRLIRSFDIESEIYDYQEIGRIPDKVKERIANSDCLIAIATKRQKIEGSQLWACPDWIQHEIALANAYKKPIAIFHEDGVKIEGLISTEERREKFSRDNLIQNIDKITRFLFNLRTYLESTYRFEKLNIPSIIRHYMNIKEEVISREVAVTRTEILMECLADELEATHHSTELEDMTPGLSVHPQQFDFVCKEKPSGMTVKPVIVQDSDHKYLWKVVFSPPLKKGEKVKYAFKIVHPNTRPFTYEELIERINQGTYEYKESICEACEWSIAYPTAKFMFEIAFPENYEVEDCYVDVKKGKVDLKAENEVKRIKDGNMFSIEKLIDKWSMSLDVPKPLQGHTYYIYYVPPKTKI